MALLGGSAGMQTQVSPQRHAPSPLGGTVCVWLSWRWHSVGHGGAAAGWARCPAQVAGSHTDGHLHHHGPLSGVTLRRSGLPLRSPPSPPEGVGCVLVPLVSRVSVSPSESDGCGVRGRGERVQRGVGMCVCTPTCHLGRACVTLALRVLPGAEPVG